MKTSKSLLKKSGTYIFLLLAVGVTTLVSSCGDEEGDIQATASLMIVNAAEGSSPQDLYLDDAKVNSQAVAYTQSSGYANVTSGSRKADFKTSGSATVNATSTLSLEGGKYYTIYYAGGGSASSSAVVTEDDRTTPSSGKAKVRFVHLSSAAASTVDLGVQGGSKIVTGLAYKAASAYAEVDPAANFQLFAAGSANAALTLNSLGLQAGKIYTIYVSGATALTINYKIVANN